jgi:chromosome partitioning protein
MRTIVLAAAKGGVGKTCLASALAVAAPLLDPRLRVAIADLDPQGSLKAWWNLRGSDQPHLVDLRGRPLAKVRSALRQEGFDLLIVDCPPGFSTTMNEAIRAANVAVIPTGSSSLDLGAIASTAEMAEAAGVAHYCVLNRAVFRSRLAGRAVTALRERGVRLLPVVHQRVAVAEAMAVGLTAMETQPNGAAAGELSALWHAVRGALDHRSARRSRLRERNLEIDIGVFHP